MAYYSGTAASLTALRTALLTHAVTDGWTLTGDVLSKAGVYFQITEDATNIKCLGCESNAVANPAPGVVMIGRIFQRTSYPTREITFPCTYRVFGFSQELYLVANYDVDRYQWMAFGKTTVPGVPGQGGWCGASVGSEIPGSDGSASYEPFSIGATFGGPSTTVRDASPGALFWRTSGVNNAVCNSWCNHGLDGGGWTDSSTGSSATIPRGPIGISYAAPLIGIQPSAWNSEAALLPICYYRQRPSNKVSLAVQLEHARHLRIDYHAPGDIITLGADKWMALPWHQKNLAVRNGSTSDSNLIDHSGTFGWAIRYEGP